MPITSEANRAFYRLTVLPLVTRTGASLSVFLGELTAASGLRLWYDADAIDSPVEPSARRCWARVGGAGFLSDEEKREAVGYGRVNRPSSSGRD